MKPSEKLFHITRRRRVPLLCTFELTRRCNLSCLHCYIDAGTRRRRPKGELTTGEVTGILEQLAAAGTLNLVFTGGEIFLRPDLIQLCRRARKLSFDLRLFTNGTLITRESAEALAETGISAIEISLYGREPIHEAVTRLPGSFKRTMRALQLLRAHGIAVTVKCPLMTINFSEYRWLGAFAKEHGIGLKLDSTLAPMDNGSKGVLRYRLNDRQLRRLYRDQSLFPCDDLPPSPGELTCSAGFNLMAIGFDGTVYPCLQLPLASGNLRTRTLKEVWHGDNLPLAAYRNIETEDLTECNGCAAAPYCQRCPGFALLEEGNLTGASRIACTLAKLQKKAAKPSS